MIFYTSVPRPHTYKLFPYTTLFRSCRRLEGELQMGQDRGFFGRALRTTLVMHRGDALTDTDSDALRSWLLRKIQDRKSTRLNSSHQIISYAVFCLKKKNK